jgi:hypothetical protein
MSDKLLVWALLFSVLVFQPLIATAGNIIDPFIGEYLGRVKIIDGDREIERDLGVKISKTKKGFNIEWTATTRKPNGKPKTKKYTIDFLPTKRSNVFAAAMKTNVFGGKEPLDPMKGDPYVWSRVTGDTLSLFALLVRDDGGYELQVYDRTLATDGLQLKYSRIRDGQPLRAIETLLRRK